MSSTVIPERALEQFRDVTKLIHEAHIRADAHAKAAHERFNIFTTLLSESDEVRLHTRFLHCLLDAEGCHDCGSLFLNLFFATLKEIPGADDAGGPVALEIPQAGSQWTVEKEFPCPPHGQIDLLLERPKFTIAIENKINAAEQPRQLACYSEFLRKRSSDTTMLIYLTKDGKQSKTHEGAPYIRISYANHILPWLEKCLLESYRIIPINQGILQYRKVVRQITGKTLQPAAMKPIAEFVGKHPDIIRYRKQIIEATDEARAGFLDDLATGISDELRRKHSFDVCLRGNGRFGKERYGDLILTPPATSVFHETPYKVWVEHDTDLKCLCVGICIVTPKFEVIPLSEGQQKFLGQMFEKLKHTPNHSGNVSPTWPTGWQNLIENTNDDETLAKLMETPIEETVSAICLKITEYITLLEHVYSESKSTTTP